MGRLHFTSIFKNLFKTRTLKIEKSNPAYSFFSGEYNSLTKDSNGNLLVLCDNHPESITKQISSLVTISSDMYSYIKCEYRQNSPTIDFEGNYIINSEYHR